MSRVEANSTLAPPSRPSPEANAPHAAAASAQAARCPPERPSAPPKRARFSSQAPVPPLSAQAALAAGVDPALAADRRRWFPAEYASWRKDKRAAWDVLPEQPDAFYLKYLPPGEKAREGVWTDEEEATFLRMLGEHRFAYEGKWGLFSMYIRGRTGLQCKAFFEGLAKTQKLGAARRVARQRSCVAHAAAAADGGADAPPEPIARMTQQRAQRRRNKAAAAAAAAVAAESSPASSSEDEMQTDKPLCLGSPAPATPPTAEPASEPPAEHDGGFGGGKPAFAPKDGRPPATAPSARTPMPAQTPVPAPAVRAESTPAPHRPAADAEARASGAPTARAAPRMQHKELRQVQMPMPMPVFAASPAAASAAAAAAEAHAAMLARIALAAAAARPCAPVRAPAQPAPGPAFAAAREPEAAPRYQRALSTDADRAAAAAMATLASACEFVRSGPSPTAGALGCLAPAAPRAGGVACAEPAGPSDGGSVAEALFAPATPAAPVREATAAAEGAAPVPAHGPASPAASPALHDVEMIPPNPWAPEALAPKPGALPACAGDEGGRAAEAAAVAPAEPNSEPHSRTDAAPSVQPAPSAPPAASGDARGSPGSQRLSPKGLSPSKGRLLFLEQLRAHHDYCALQRARLALVEAEQHELLQLRLGGQISPFERACASLAPEPAKRLKKLHASAAAWGERQEQGARSELSRSQEATRAALLAQQKMESAALRAMSVWFRQRDEQEPQAAHS